MDEDRKKPRGATLTPNLPPASRHVTMKDVAERCGVSKWTVSSALRHDRRVKASTAERIRAIAKEMGYNPSLHEAARRMAFRKHGKRAITRNIASLLYRGSARTHYVSLMLAGMLDAALEEGFGVQILDSIVMENLKLHLDQELPVSIARQDTDGIVLSQSMVGFGDALDALRERAGFGWRNIVSTIWPLSGYSSVLADDEQGGYMIARHLLELGHRHFLALRYKFYGSEPESRRIQGVRRAMAEFGLAADSHLHFHRVVGAWINPDAANNSPNEFEVDSKRFMSTWESLPSVTAIIALNDASALHCRYFLQGQGLSVPRDVSIVGYDDTDALPDDRGINQLTTVRMPLVEIGQEAAHLLIRQVRGEIRKPVTHILPVELVIRGTTAPPKKLA